MSHVASVEVSARLALHMLMAVCDAAMLRTGPTRDALWARVRQVLRSDAPARLPTNSSAKTKKQHSIRKPEGFSTDICHEIKARFSRL